MADEMDEPGEETQVAQNVPPGKYTPEQFRSQAAPPPTSTPGGTPIKSPGGVPPAGPAAGDDPLKSMTAPAPNSPDEIRRRHEAAQKRKDTITADEFEVLNTFPQTKEQLAEWAATLSKRHLEMAKTVSEWLIKNGKKGITDPNLSPKEKEVVWKLFIETSPHWFEQNKKKHGTTPSSPDDPNFFKSKGKHGDLKNDAGALAMLGGNYLNQAGGADESMSERRRIRDESDRMGGGDYTHEVKVGRR